MNLLNANKVGRKLQRIKYVCDVCGKIIKRTSTIIEDGEKYDEYWCKKCDFAIYEKRKEEKKEPLKCRPSMSQIADKKIILLSPAPGSAKTDL